ncbi:MAG TPA: hypothetical protein VFE46_08935 [Pirellulales bacterium]|jgi:hypothetical protein|nr:hypothetical protein [Pirellulales bacterium]
MRMQAQKMQDRKPKSQDHHGKEKRPDDDARKRGRKLHISQQETSQLRAQGGSGHS